MESTTPTPEKPKRKLSKKQKGFVKDYIATGNGTQAALKNYDIESEDKINVANAIAVENLQKPTIQQAIRDMASRIPDDLLEKVHLEGLNAYRESMSEEGEGTLTPDFATRHKYLDSAYKLKGSYAAEKNFNLNIDLKADANPEALALAKKYEEEIKKGL